MMRGRPGTLLGVALLFSLSVLPLGAASSGKGTFHFGKTTFEPIDTFAYQVDTKDPAKPMTIVVLSNFKIDRPAVLEAIDPVGAFVMQAADKGSFVMVRMVAPDRCGVSGLLGPTQQQIDLGESFTAKTTASTASRIAGECATTKP